MRTSTSAMPPRPPERILLGTLRRMLALFVTLVKLRVSYKGLLLQPSKLAIGVRVPSPAPSCLRRDCLLPGGAGHTASLRCRTTLSPVMLARRTTCTPRSLLGDALSSIA